MTSGDRPLEVAVNLLWCLPGQVGGSEEYLDRQWTGVGEIDPDGRRVAPTIFAPAGWAQAHPDLASRHPVHVAPADLRRRSVRILTEHTWLATRTRRHGFDLVHHGGGTVPGAGPKPVLLTVHDLQYLHHPEFHSATKLRYLRAAVPASVRRAALVTTPSEWVRSTVLEAFDLDPDRVMVVPHGVPAATPVEAGTLDELRSRHGLEGRRWIVYPAVTHPHKRHLLLLDALCRYHTDPELVLVLLGGRGLADDAVTDRIRDLGLGDRILRPGRVPDADRDAFVAGAEALVFPSAYEGFGAPLLEAMNLGVPVVAGDHPAIREVVADAAVVVSDGPEAWAAAIDEAVARRDELVGSGRARAGAFTSAVSGAALVEACERAVGG